MSIFTGDGLDYDPATSRPSPPATGEALLASFDSKVVLGLTALRAATDADLDRPWRFSVLGKLYFERARGRVFRDFSLSHLIHHRGQLSVYLRLLDVPVPGAYGPSGDEKG